MCDCVWMCDLVDVVDLQDQALPGLRDVKYRHFLEAPRPMEPASVRAPQHRPRSQRSAAALSTGVKVCPQESMKEVITSHRAYYKLRGTAEGHASVDGYEWERNTACSHWILNGFSFIYIISPATDEII